MQRQSPEEFLLSLLETIDDLPPTLASRFDELLKKDDGDRSQAIRELFEDIARE